MKNSSLYQWDQIQEEIILLSVQWYISYPLTYSQLKNAMEKRGFKINSDSMNNLIHQYSIAAQKKFKETSSQRKGGWRVVQIPFQIKGKKKYLYRALNAQGNTLDFMISSNRNTQKAKSFFSENLSSNRLIQSQLVEKRKHITKKNTFNLIVQIITGLLLFISASYAVNLLGNQTKIKRKSEINYQEKNNQLQSSDRTASINLLPPEKAFLDTIAWAEGTLNPHGYNLLIGGEKIEDLSAHPQKCIPVKLGDKSTCSTAFGRYQILDFNGQNMSFTPEKQDQWAINKLEQIGVLSKINETNIKEAIFMSCKVWSSFPCHENDSQGYYNQPVKSLQDLVSKYEERLLLYQ